MTDTEKLEHKISQRIKAKGLTAEQKLALAREINYLANLVIDMYKKRKDGKQ